MTAILLALAFASTTAGASSPDWRPSGCTPERRLTVAQLRATETEAARGSISASVSLECHFLAIGKPDIALTWLRRSAEIEPITGQRYVNYLLSTGEKESCRKAYELTARYLALKWDYPKLNANLAAQHKRANKCR
jgi:hypothetical protein